MNADAKPNTKLKLLNADEISTAVYHRAGLKVEPHDVSIRDMLIMQAMFAAVMENIQKQQIAQFQHDIAHFQAALTETATPIIEASEELQELKVQIIQEILASNAKSQQENETNLYNQISQRLQQQTQQHIQQHWTRFSGSLKTLLLLGFVVQSVLLTIVIVVSR